MKFKFLAQLPYTPGRRCAHTRARHRIGIRTDGGGARSDGPRAPLATGGGGGGAGPFSLGVRWNFNEPQRLCVPHSRSMGSEAVCFSFLFFLLPNVSGLEARRNHDLSEFHRRKSILESIFVHARLRTSPNLTTALGPQSIFSPCFSVTVECSFFF